VQANIGSPIQEDYDEAMNALAPKKQQIVIEEEAPEPQAALELADLEPDVNYGDETAELQITVTNPSGLHARPAATFIQTVKKYDAKLTVTNRTNATEPVVVKGMISVMLLAAKQGDELFLQATGPDKDVVLAELKDLFLANFGE
jgi:phosphotransferase system HPr (HPr) family protein